MSWLEAILVAFAGIYATGVGVWTYLDYKRLDKLLRQMGGRPPPQTVVITGTAHAKVMERKDVNE